MKPWGFIWKDYSCAYDSLFGILIKAFKQNKKLIDIKSTKQALFLVDLSQKSIVNSYSNNNTRDTLRIKLHHLQASEFPLNSTQGTDINVLCDFIFDEKESIYFKQYTCTTCNISKKLKLKNIIEKGLTITCSRYIWKKQKLISGTARLRTPAEWVEANFQVQTSHSCFDCHTPFICETVVHSKPTFIRFKVEDILVNWISTMYIDSVEYRLCGLIYYGNNHFTARIITKKDEVWFNDGLINNENYIYENKSNNFQSNELAICTDNRRLIMSIYVKVL